jgi:hypothetical protein
MKLGFIPWACLANEASDCGVVFSKVAKEGIALFGIPASFTLKHLQEYEGDGLSMVHLKRGGHTKEMTTS